MKKKRKYQMKEEYLISTRVMIGPEIHQVKNQYSSKGLLPNIIRMSSMKLLKPTKRKTFIKHLICLYYHRYIQSAQIQ